MFKAFKPGDIHNNRFLIIHDGINNGVSLTYLAFDIYQMKNIFLKIMETKQIQKYIGQPEYKQYKLLTSFDHPNIIKAYSFQKKQIKGIQYFIMITEYAQYGNLYGCFKQLKVEDIFKIYHQAKSVIQYIHARRILHRDLTLRNILLDNKKNVKVINFDISIQLEQEDIYNDYYGFRTRLYAPIQFISESIVTKQNDLWQFGITLIQLATGKEIYQLTNNKQPYSIKNFPEQIFIRYNVNNKFRSMISPLLRYNYKERKFCEDIFSIQPILYLTKLKLIRITDIQLPASINKKQIQHLLQLECSNCLLTDESGKIIRLFKKLQKLDMSGNNLTDKFTYHIESLLVQLMTLKLAFTNITDESLSLITNRSFMSLITMKSLMLQQLDISYTLVSQTGIMMISKLIKLSSLAIWSGQYYYPQRYEDIINMGTNKEKYQNNYIDITQECIIWLCKLTNLKEICINADGRDIDDLLFKMSKQATCVEVKGKMKSKTVEYVCGMEKLEKVYLEGVETFEIKEFRSKELKFCELVNCKIDKNLLIKSLSINIKMRHLNLGQNDIDKQGVINIANNIKVMKYLNLNNNNIGKEGAIHISENMQILVCLNLRNNNVGKQGAISIAKNMKILTSLNLNNNKIGNQGTIQITKNMNRLISLDLGNNNIGKQGVISIVSNMKNLICLNLQKNNIGNQEAMKIAYNMKSLTFLSLKDNNIDNDTKQMIKQMLPKTAVQI